MIPDAESAVERYLQSRRNPNTRSAYAVGLRSFLAWCHEKGLDPLVDVKRVHVRRWARHLEVHAFLAPSTVTQRLFAVKGFFNYAIQCGWVAENPVDWLRFEGVPMTVLVVNRDWGEA